MNPSCIFSFIRRWKNRLLSILCTHNMIFSVNEDEEIRNVFIYDKVCTYLVNTESLSRFDLLHFPVAFVNEIGQTEVTKMNNI
jgi:hypothetical protein